MMGRMTPVQSEGWRTAAEREVERRAAERRRAIEQHAAMDRAWRWVESRPALAVNEGLSCFAATMILWQRVPAGLDAQAGEDWIVAAYRRRQGKPRQVREQPGPAAPGDVPSPATTTKETA